MNEHYNPAAHIAANDERLQQERTTLNKEVAEANQEKAERLAAELVEVLHDLQPQEIKWQSMIGIAQDALPNIDLQSIDARDINAYEDQALTERGKKVFNLLSQSPIRKHLAELLNRRDDIQRQLDDIEPGTSETTAAPKEAQGETETGIFAEMTTEEQELFSTEPPEGFQIYQKGETVDLSDLEDISVDEPAQQPVKPQAKIATGYGGSVARQEAGQASEASQQKQTEASSFEESELDAQLVQEAIAEAEKKYSDTDYEVLTDVEDGLKAQLEDMTEEIEYMEEEGEQPTIIKEQKIQQRRLAARLQTVQKLMQQKAPKQVSNG